MRKRILLPRMYTFSILLTRPSLGKRLEMVVGSSFLPSFYAGRVPENKGRDDRRVGGRLIPGGDGDVLHLAVHVVLGIEHHATVHLTFW